MYSAHTNRNDIMQQCNANDFLAKPFDINNLIDKKEFQLKNSN
jgi:DNA-binding response OmpR family regulator